MVVSLRERRRQILRNEILEAARQIVAEKGHTAMSMEELAARVGISKPTLYSFFPTKEELVVAAMSCAMKQLLTLIEEARTDQTPLQRLAMVLRIAVQHRVDEMGTIPRTWPPDISQLLNEHPETLNDLRRLDTEVVSLVHAGITRGEIDPGLDQATIVWAVYALLGVPYLTQFSSGGIPDPATVATTLALILERGICNHATYTPPGTM